MKVLSLAAAALSVLCLIRSVTAAPTAHIFLIAGQQNAVGFNWDGHTSEDQPKPNIFQLNCCEDGSRIPLPVDQCFFNVSNDPLLHNCFPAYRRGPFIGFGMSFARELIKDIPSDDLVFLIPAAQSPSGFMQGGWNAYWGEYFLLAQQKVQHTHDLIRQQYPKHTPVFAGSLWNQGEWDSGANGKMRALPFATYLFENLIPMIEAFRDPNVLNFTSPTLPFVVGNMLESWVSNTSFAYGNVTNESLRRPVSDAIGMLSQYCNYTASVPSNGLLGDPKMLFRSERIMFTARSQRILGKRYYAAWKAAKLNQPESTGPIPTNINVDVTDEIRQLAGTFDLLNNESNVATMEESATPTQREAKRSRSRRHHHTNVKLL